MLIVGTMPIEHHVYIRETNRRIYETLSYYIATTIPDLS